MATSEANARVMVPITITNSMIKSGTTVPDVDATQGETLWVASANYAVGVIKNYNGSRFNCILAHSGITTPPDVDPLRWDKLGPSNRMAPFDDYSTTKAVSTGSLTYVLQPGFFNGLSIYGLEGVGYDIVVKDAPGGNVVMSSTGDLYEQAAGFYELLYTNLLMRSQISFSGIPITPGAELTITLTSAPGARVALGTIKVGDWRQFIGQGTKGSTQYGAESERKSYSFYKENFDGSYSLTRRPSTRNISCTVVIDAEQGVYADAILGEILDIAVPFEATSLPKYAYLNTLGFVSGNIRADNYGESSLSLKIKGNL